MSILTSEGWEIVKDGDFTLKNLRKEKAWPILSSRDPTILDLFDNVFGGELMLDLARNNQVQYQLYLAWRMRTYGSTFSSRGKNKF